jgi:polyhydroxybutyrate depolymerase
LRPAQPEEIVAVGGVVRRALFLVLSALGCAQPGATDAPLRAGDHARELAHGGRERSYVLHVPPGRAAAPRPLLLAFHGGAGNGPGFQRYAGLDALADRDGWLVAYPNGTHRWFTGRLLTWNAGDCCGFASDAGIDDVGFALALIEDVGRLAPLDRSRTYATGHSNGAMMAYRLAAEAPERVAAIAPVAGAMAFDAFAPRRPVPVLHIHSIDDPRALYAGGPTEVFGREIRHRAVEEQLARWRALDGCPPEPATLETRRRPAGDGRVDSATLLAWAPCVEGSEVQLWKLSGGGHGWPGSDPVLPERMMGPRTDVISAAEEIWRFLARFSRPR